MAIRSANLMKLGLSALRSQIANPISVFIIKVIIFCRSHKFYKFVNKQCVTQVDLDLEQKTIIKFLREKRCADRNGCRNQIFYSG